MFTQQVSKNNENVKIQMIVSSNDSLEVVCGEKIWPSNGFFKDQVTDHHLEKLNYPGNTLFHVNQAFLTVQKGQKKFSETTLFCNK